jgi:uncharacterized protein (DUF2147 family)
MRVLIIILLGCCSVVALSTHAENITGKWRTIDDETGKAKSIVEIYEEGGKYYGRVLDLLLKPDDTLCDKCKDDLHNKTVVGMVILSDMQKEGDEYNSGEILDPAKGNFYRCKMWLEDGNLQVRGYIAFLYRTQTWYRIDNNS